MTINPKNNKAIQTTRMLLVDDDANFRRRVKELLGSEPDLEIIGEAEEGETAILIALAMRPDLVLMDVRMPGLNGLQVSHRLKSEVPDLKIIILTLFDLEAYRNAAIALGASDYLSKKSVVKELVPAIRRAMKTAHPPGEGANQ